MKNNFKHNQNRLFSLASKGLKFFLLTLLGFTITFIVSRVFNVTWMNVLVESAIVWVWLSRIAVSLFCLFAIAIVTESWS
ncbi:hypothetical protein [Nodularia sp. NIES-3585]|uniref:hypothetical protein n=1 Tax=Nodularia sp. NIES-3585 TaxID=1973477 RepID=UPI000B5CBD2F|nr:hypothetical protein [Nodularia sp. NIES-3585]GAX37044.1 hypothetical protein NIES3585_30840 [Nodularia sp. NIES-3585]